MKMKKIIFIALSALLAFALITCDDLQNVGALGSATTDMVFDSDGGITLYLDGTTVPVTKAQRALTKDLALIGYDFFEVVFLKDYGTLGEIVRTSWEIGEAAGAKVLRNVDYDLIDPTVADGTNGAAILFVGRKSDKALLGIGKLTDVDTGTPGTLAPGTMIDATTTKVRFTVAALQAGASFNSALNGGGTADDTTALYPTNTSFRVGTITDIKRVKEGQREFPAYSIPVGTAATTTAATFTLGSADITGTTDNIGSYLPAVRISSAPELEKRIPRFILGSQYKEIKSPYSSSTTFAFTNNATANAALANPVTLNIITAAKASGPDGFIAITFKIPVYAMNITDTADGVKPITWYIRPGFGTDYYNLDDGKGGAGGALLLAVGDAFDDHIEIVTVNK